MGVDNKELDTNVEEPKGGNQGADNKPKGKATIEPGGVEPKFTQEDVNTAIEARLLRERKKFNAQLEAKAEELVKTKLEEKQRISALSEDERKEELLTQREKDLKDLEDKLNYRERFTDTEKALRDRKLPSTFAKFLIAEDEEKTFDNVKEFQKSYEEALKDGVTEALRGDTPKASTTKVNAVTKDKFAKMSYLERLELKRKDEELYNKLK